MVEKEYWGLLTQQQFTSNLEKFTLKLGKPIKKTRLSIEVTDWLKPHKDNRIKITNGKAEFVQKVGDWNSRERSELEIPLINDCESIFNFYKALIVLVDAKEPAQTIMQHENYLFDLEAVEIKLSHQTGKSDKYTFEVELKTQTGNLDEICNSLGLEPDHEIKDKAFWDKWNEELNFDGQKLSDLELKALISKYLKQI